MNVVLPIILGVVALLAVAWALMERARANRADERAWSLSERAEGAPNAELLKAQAAEQAHAVAEALIRRADAKYVEQEKLTQAKLEAQLKPVAETLAKFQEQVVAAEKARAEES